MKTSRWNVSTSRLFSWPLLISLLYRFIFFLFHFICTWKFKKKKVERKLLWLFNAHLVCMRVSACMFIVVDECEFLCLCHWYSYWSYRVVVVNSIAGIDCLTRLLYCFYYYVVHSSWLTILHQRFSAVANAYHIAQMVYIVCMTILSSSFSPTHTHNPEQRLLQRFLMWFVSFSSNAPLQIQKWRKQNLQRKPISFYLVYFYSSTEGK